MLVLYIFVRQFNNATLSCFWMMKICHVDERKL